MFKRKYRLLFHHRLTKASVIHTDSFILKITPNGLSHNRYGFLVSKRIDKRAVVRNRVKRVFRAYLEELHERLIPGNDMLFIFKPHIKDAVGKDVYAVLTTVLVKKKLLPENEKSVGSR